MPELCPISSGVDGWFNQVSFSLSWNAAEKGRAARNLGDTSESENSVFSIYLNIEAETKCCHFADDFFNFMYENCILIQISLKFVPKG